MTRSIEVPEIEWAFVCSTVLGSVAAGARDRLFMGREVPYCPEGSLGYGARWCSPDWLIAHRAGRGNPARVQGMASSIGISRRGYTLRPYIVVLPDDGLEHAARMLSAATARGARDPEGLAEWTFAVVRFPGQTRFGVSLRGDGWEHLCRQLAKDIGIDWRVWFTPGGNQPDGPVPDTCTIANGKGRGLVTWSDGFILMEEEPVPDEFLRLAGVYGNGFGAADRGGADLRLPSTRNRELEPDELGIARGYLDHPTGPDG